METNAKALRADISNEQDYIWLKCKQYDNLSREYRIIITDKGIPLRLIGTETVYIRMQAENESTPYVYKTLDWANGYPIVVFTSNMLSKIGRVKFEFVVFDSPGGTAVVSTRQQGLLVQESLVDYDGLIASEDFDVLSNLISQALVIPNLINEFNLTKDEVDQLVTQINVDMLNYQSQFTEMQTNINDLIQSTNDYIQQLTADVNNTLNQANTALSTATQLINTANDTLVEVNQRASEANDNALLSQRYAKGGVIPEDTEDNAEWYYRQTKNLKEQVDTASKLIIPQFYINFEEGELWSETEAKGMDFWVDDGDF